MTTKDAIDHFREAFKNDPDFRYTYQSNIAMAFYDEYERAKENKSQALNIHEIANKAADNFLNLWLAEPK